jgi:SAM-dependent methyltransferase
VGQYRQALQTVGLDRNYHLLRMTFAEAHLLFPDEFFDFVYVDGYAHSGEEGGRTILDWYAKVKPGGILAGDDYDPVRWPLVVWGVHNLVAQIGVPLRVTEHILEGTYNNYASWFIVKPTDPDAPIPQPDLVLQKLGQEERIAVAARKAAQRAAKRAARLKDSPPRES